MSKILVFENAISDQQFLQSCLEPKFETHIFSDARNCIEKTLEIEPDLILMDLSLESCNVLEARSQLRKHRSTSKIPVILLSTVADVESKHFGTRNERSDFVFKPLERKDLLMHIEQRLTRAQRNEHGIESHDHLWAGDVAIDAGRGVVFLGPPDLKLKNRLQIDLNPSEIQLLTYFIKNEGVTFSRTEIQTALGLPVADRSIDSLVFQLRRELKPVAHYFQTVYGKGYRFQSGAKNRRA